MFPNATWKGRTSHAVLTGTDAEGLLEQARPTWRTEPFKVSPAERHATVEELTLTSSRSLPQLENTAFAGTMSMPWTAARSRSTGMLAHDPKARSAMPIGPGALDEVLKKRHTTHFDDLVEILRKAMVMDRSPDLWSFKQPYNAHRHITVTAPTEEQDRRKVLRTLRSAPLCDVYDLARCPADLWAEISRELGGVGHGDAIRCALEHVQNNFSRTERAAFWTAVGTRQQSSHHGRVMSFPGDRGEPY